MARIACTLNDKDLLIGTKVGKIALVCETCKQHLSIFMDRYVWHRKPQFWENMNKRIQSANERYNNKLVLVGNES